MSIKKNLFTRSKKRQIVLKKNEMIGTLLKNVWDHSIIRLYNHYTKKNKKVMKTLDSN